MKRLVVIAIVALLGLLVFWQSERVIPGATSSTSPIASSPTAPNAQPSTLNSQPSVEPRSTLADALNSPGTTIAADVRLVSDVVTTYRSNFPRDGNPVGNNAEITAALTGKNKLRFSFIPPDHPAINQAGELCDRWGTPFIFHANSGTQMEIRSAGPDKKPYTPDDVILTP